jgi:hypothetical protein
MMLVIYIIYFVFIFIEYRDFYNSDKAGEKPLYIDIDKIDNR